MTDGEMLPEIPAGMKPWTGGESAPADWDGGPVRTKDGDLFYSVGEGQAYWEHDGGDEQIVAYTPRPTVPDRDEGYMAALRDPTVVHLNMLRGGIAKPTPANIWHLYGDEALIAAMPASARALADRQPDQRGGEVERWDIGARVLVKLTGETGEIIRTPLIVQADEDDGTQGSMGGTKWVGEMDACDLELIAAAPRPAEQGEG